jgi:hypothetical protein
MEYCPRGSSAPIKVAFRDGWLAQAEVGRDEIPSLSIALISQNAELLVSAKI